MNKPNNDEVICPKCCEQFRAVPVNVQAEIEALRSELERLRGALLTGASLLEQGCNATDMADSMRRAATEPKEEMK